MFNSTEIRWFSRTTYPSIGTWFATHGLTFETVADRTDFYLPKPFQDDESIKLREGNVEIKIRKGVGRSTKFTSSARGIEEDWVKWSFSISKDDPLAPIILHERKFDWIAIQKERIGVKIAPAGNGLHIVPITERIPYGCQVEYTRLLVEDEEWYTFGLEWFGEQMIAVDPELREAIIQNTRLTEQDSYGYAAFLKKYC